MRWVCCLLGLCLLAACSKDSGGFAGSTIETENTIAMDVLLENGVPAAHTKIVVVRDDYLAGTKSTNENQQNIETDEKGYVELKYLPLGSYVVEARGDGEKAAYRLQVKDSSFKEIQIAMKTVGVLDGVVKYNSSRLPVKVAVSGLDYVVETDSAGNFEFGSLPEGEFKFVAFEYAKITNCEKNPAGGLECFTFDRVLNIASAEAEIKSGERTTIVLGNYLPSQQKPVVKDTVVKDTVPVDTLPVDTVPVDSIPVDSIPLDTLPVDTVPVDTVPVDTTPVYPYVMFEDFEDSTYGWYAAFSKYANAKLSAAEAGFGREGLAAHFEYTIDSLYNWVLMGTAVSDTPKNFSDLDSIVFFARGSGYMMFSLDRYKDSVYIKTWKRFNLDSLVESEDNPWIRIRVLPEDFIAADSSGGNMGWDAVKEAVSTINFFGGSESSELWIDDVEIYGVKDMVKKPE